MRTQSITYFLLLIITACSLFSCQEDNTTTEQGSEEQEKVEQNSKILFKQLSSDQTAVTFNNKLDMTKLKLSLDYINVYNGGGVGVGDINNDGLEDLYFTGNLVDNKLYLNKGNFNFEDITAKAGVACSNSWSTGVTMADVNNDGWLDIYVCRSYHDKPNTLRENQLFINNGDLTFTESSKQYGVNDDNYSIQASFFDYDQDGHLDLYVGNHPRFRREDQSVHYKYFTNPVIEYSDRLYKNNGNGTFTDVTKKSGVLNYGWSLGLSPSDYNGDGLTDIYVAVDHFEPDKLYQNNGDGTFTNVLEDKFKHITTSSMGSDAADINNDGLVDLFVVDMLAQDNFLQKTQMGSMNPERFWEFTRIGYHYQYMRNQLHLNTGKESFVDIGQMAGLHNTDWSWATLAMDLNNDGWKDYFIANGYYRNILDKDLLKKMRKEMYLAQKENKSLVDAAINFNNNLTTTKSKNYCYQNSKNLQFKDVSASSGLDHLGYSNGAAYVDLDKDGKLDIVVNNIDDQVGIYQNSGSTNHYIKFDFSHSKKMHPIGAKVLLSYKDGKQFQEFQPTRGYQSSVSHTLHFGLGNTSEIDKVEITWPDGQQQVLTRVKADQVIKLNYEDAGLKGSESNTKVAMFEEQTSEKGIAFEHQENKYDDYKKQILLPHKMSQFGPFVCTGDVNGDKLMDFYVGGAAGQAGQIYLQNSSGKFEVFANSAITKDKDYEDMGASLFDADGDGDLDLYVVSGGNAFEPNDPMYSDRFYLNDGKGKFTKHDEMIPQMTFSGSCVKPADMDGDGDLDLFVGGRHYPGAYPYAVNSYVLENVGDKFMDATPKKAPGFEKLGMVTDAIWTDLNGDQRIDLIVTGEWMAPKVFINNENGQLVDQTSASGLEKESGWWNNIEAGDFDEDGDMDFIVGNLGLNYKYTATHEKPFHVYAADFDNNNSFDIALGYINQDKIYPVRGRQCSSEQCPKIAKEFPSYAEFASATIDQVYGEELKYALHLQATNFSSSILINQGNGSFDIKELPIEAQVSPINGIIVKDFDQDGHLDVLTGGNLFVSEVETGRADAGTGLLLKGNGKAEFSAIPFVESGFYIPGDVKDLQLIDLGNENTTGILVANNDGPLRFWKTK